MRGATWRSVRGTEWSNVCAIASRQAPNMMEYLYTEWQLERRSVLTGRLAGADRIP